jgi:hypothetical protein
MAHVIFVATRADRSFISREAAATTSDLLTPCPRRPSDELIKTLKNNEGWSLAWPLQRTPRQACGRAASVG